jgi:hypothetical protein
MEAEPIKAEPSKRKRRWFMRVAKLIVAAVIGFGVGNELGQPRLYWHGDPSEVEWWAFCTGGCSIAVTLLVVFWPDRRTRPPEKDDAPRPTNTILTRFFAKMSAWFEPR